jgi:hypothetical protein
VQGAQASASTGRQSTADAVKITQDRMKERLEEVRASVSKQISLTSPRLKLAVLSGALGPMAAVNPGVRGHHHEPGSPLGSPLHKWL